MIKMDQQVTVIITVYNQKESLLYCLEHLKNVQAIGNIIIIDMKSADGTRSLLPGLGYDYIVLEESDDGGAAQAWNTVISNFYIEDVVVFMRPQYLLGKQCFTELTRTLEIPGTGVAGAVSNGFEFSQNLQMPEIKNLEELYEIERLQKTKEAAYKVMGVYSGLWAVKKKILEEIGPFQEELKTATYSLIDYQLRMIQKGYQPVVCKRAVAYDIFKDVEWIDYDSLYQNLDLDILRKKWKVNYLSFTPNNLIVDLIQEEKEAEFKVLEAGCNMGATLLDIQGRYPNCKIYGLEINEAAVSIADHLLEIKAGNIEDRCIPFEEKFDYIIFADVLEHLRIPQEVIGYCREILNKDGCILACIPNLMNIGIMEQIIQQGRFTYTDAGLMDRTHIHLFTYYEMISMFDSEKYKVEEVSYRISDLTGEQSVFMEQLLQLSKNVEPHMYQACQYLIKARKQED